jgi:hypothetical protein
VKEQRVSVNRIVRRQELYANVIRACRNCGAPGFWHNTPGVNVGCYAPEKVTKLGEDPVGTICPCCGAPREVIEPHGMIWSKVWRVSVWNAIKGAVAEIFFKRRNMT